jgi:4'-phosphopantetheinyl transferase
MTREARTGQETDRIDLWLAWPDASEDSSLIERYTALVTNEERARARRFHFPRDRHNYVVTPALVRTTLSRYAPVGPSPKQNATPPLP